MKTYTDLQDLYTSLTNDSTTTNITLGMSLTNDYIRKMAKTKNWWFMTDTATDTSVADQVEYYLPRECDILENVYFVISDEKYIPTEIKSRVNWDCLTASESSSTYPEYYYIQNNKISFYPTPSTAAYTIYFIYKKKVVSLSKADYTTGTITLTNEDATVTGAGTTFLNSMVGRYLKYNENWYKIKTFTSTTSLELEYAYDGTTVAGASYTIGEVSVLPEDYQEIPVYKAASVYYTKKGLTPRAQLFDGLYNEGVKEMLANEKQKTNSVSLNQVNYTFNSNFNPKVS